MPHKLVFLMTFREEKYVLGIIITAANGANYMSLVSAHSSILFCCLYYVDLVNDQFLSSFLPARF